MIKNAKSLMDKSRNLAATYNITANEVLQNYMFERILERLSILSTIPSSSILDKYTLDIPFSSNCVGFIISLFFSLFSKFY